ncbi:TonB-dependent receptor [Mitsuaria sp. GD03876]|uniref:TonB-dependent receptor n=1 Tax=Mitsuaria sp. GD03876 TaxID=2975399 RepID=UPI0024479E64|nr:TonB-dependent receptor [Mitsuaria sp. GD03876]MDH0864111.1 TonB-dependent receptor [Mitsuaria sp. GD03876]
MTATSRATHHALAIAVAVLLGAGALSPSHAQVSRATVRGLVTAPAGMSAGGLSVTATNSATGARYRTATRADGRYALVGLAPGEYIVSVAGADGAPLKTERLTLSVGESAALDLPAASATPAQGEAVQLGKVTVEGTAIRQGVKDSQLGTVVSQRMIEALPQNTRNFLSAADLAPGVAFSSDASGLSRVQSGAQDFDHLNVFIDGVGQKNNILRGGLSGQDNSRGNPFPQSAISEYKVLTQNYKAEFDQVSSAAITAVTKSGTNEFHGEVYADRTGTNWRGMNALEKERERQGIPRPASEKYEYGGSVGGPIVKDKLHFFVAYDGKRIEDSRQIAGQNFEKLPDAGIVPGLRARRGSQVDPFHEDLLFGKLDAQLNDEHRLTLSARLRRETDRIAEDRNLSLPGNDKERRNDETRVDLKHEWSRGDWLSEARVGYEDYVWNPRSAADSPLVRYKVSTASPQVLTTSQDVILDGGSPDAQRRQQRGTFFSEELTFTGLDDHVIKGGVKLKDMRYDLSGTANSVDRVETLIDTTTGLPYWDGANCTGTTVSNNGTSSDQCRITRAAAPAVANFKNKQWGLYLQDDWSVTEKLELNLGIRWDYEDNMLNNGYATPADRIAALMAPDVARYGLTPPPGQTYAQSLAKGGIDISQYISDGNSRRAFKNAFAPRVGFSYDVFGDRKSVVFGGYGRSYDRTMANHALDELQKNQAAAGEIWLIRNDLKMPYADQFSLGLRQALTPSWNGEIAISRIEAKNQFVWFSGNRDANGGFAQQSGIDPLWGGPNGYGQLVLGDSIGRTRTDSIFVKAEKPYTASSGWTATLAYTYSDAKTTNLQWSNDTFDWTYGRAGRGWNPSTLVDRHRLVGAFMTDKLLPWGLTFSAKGTYASGFPRRLTNCLGGTPQCFLQEGESPSYRQVDISVGKRFKWGQQEVGLRLDVLNVFGADNYNGFDDWIGNAPAAGAPANRLGGDNLNLDKPNSARGDNRALRVVVNYKF